MTATQNGPRKLHFPSPHYHDFFSRVASQPQRRHLISLKRKPGRPGRSAGACGRFLGPSEVLAGQPSLHATRQNSWRPARTSGGPPELLVARQNFWRSAKISGGAPELLAAGKTFWSFWRKAKTFGDAPKFLPSRQNFCSDGNFSGSLPKLVEARQYFGIISGRTPEVLAAPQTASGPPKQSAELGWPAQTTVSVPKVMATRQNFWQRATTSGGVTNFWRRAKTSGGAHQFWLFAKTSGGAPKFLTILKNFRFTQGFLENYCSALQHA